MRSVRERGEDQCFPGAANLEFEVDQLVIVRIVEPRRLFGIEGASLPQGSAFQHAIQPARECHRAQCRTSRKGSRPTRNRSRTPEQAPRRAGIAQRSSSRTRTSDTAHTPRNPNTAHRRRTTSDHPVKRPPHPARIHSSSSPSEYPPSLGTAPEHGTSEGIIFTWAAVAPQVDFEGSRPPPPPEALVLR